MELSDYSRIVRQRWRVIAIVMLVAVGLGLVLSFAVRPTYRSTARVFVTASTDGGSTAYQDGLFLQQRTASYLDLLNGETIARQVIEELGLDESPRVLASHLSASADPESLILSISVVDSSRDSALIVAQAAAEEFVTFVEDLETPRGADGPDVEVTIIEPASKPGGAVSPQPGRTLTLAVILGLLAAFAAAVLRDVTDRRVTDEDQLGEATDGLPLLGRVLGPKDGEPALITDLAPYEPRLEAFRVLRTRVLAEMEKGPRKVILVTGALPEDDSAGLACNLALSLAATDRRVLVIDADLRRPQASALLGHDSATGLSDLLGDGLDLQGVVRSAGPNLDLLPGGVVPDDPSELLQSAAMRSVVDQARREYELVLITSPPALPVADASILGTRADGVILVVARGARLGVVDSATERLRSVGAPLLGTVLTSASGRRRRRQAQRDAYAPVPAGEPQEDPRPKRRKQGKRAPRK